MKTIELSDEDYAALKNLLEEMAVFGTEENQSCPDMTTTALWCMAAAKIQNGMKS